MTRPTAGPEATRSLGAAGAIEAAATVLSTIRRSRWADRALMVRGPGGLGLKYAARQLFLNQGDMEALTQALIPIGERLVNSHLAERGPGGAEKAALEELFPRYEGLHRRSSRWIRIVV